MVVRWKFRDKFLTLVKNSAGTLAVVEHTEEAVWGDGRLFNMNNEPIKASIHRYAPVEYPTAWDTWEDRKVALAAEEWVETLWEGAEPHGEWSTYVMASEEAIMDEEQDSHMQGDQKPSWVLFETGEPPDPPQIPLKQLH